ncbi:MAG: hypothetical protein AMDU1_APLC00099G0002 [Thermoplasmatales archaeon A-plasma]|jgi:homogentisate 1,2-dioxygenase|nr:MAG: hypothetical protein AMDU1_APLC00099G0002 [Thermoplasmatales archaeon A-plasma]
MVFYVKQGKMPESRHTYDDRNSILREELFGEESFEGPYSLLYHIGDPTRVKSVSRLHRDALDNGSSEEMIHRHFETGKFERKGSFITGRRYLMFNSSVRISVGSPLERSASLYRNALHDEVYFIHSGNATVISMMGNLKVSAGDYLYVPKGTTYTMDVSPDLVFFLVESRERASIPARYLNIYGQIKEGSPYYTRDIRVPKLSEPSTRTGSFQVLVDFGDYFLREERDMDPFDVVGWDGYLYPFAISTGSMAPIVGKLHQPPPVHETFSARSFMIGTFLPRKFDFHPRSIPISYFHSNIDTDEVLFYSSGSFMSRRGISAGSVTLHVRGLIHGPQPGALEAAIGKEGTDEVAVMVEAYEPLKIARDAKEVEDRNYMGSWYR